MELDTVKILIIFALFILTLFAALLPLQCLKLTARIKSKKKGRKQDGCDGNIYNGPDCPESSLVAQNATVAPSSRRPRQKNKRKVLIMSVLNCFAGGIFLGTSFIELLPEIRKCFAQFDIRWPDLTPSHRSVVRFLTFVTIRLFLMQASRFRFSVF